MCLCQGRNGCRQQSSANYIAENSANTAVPHRVVNWNCLHVWVDGQFDKFHPNRRPALTGTKNVTTRSIWSKNVWQLFLRISNAHAAKSNVCVVFPKPYCNTTWKSASLKRWLQTTMRIIVLPTWRAANQSHCASSILAKSRSSTSMTLHLASDSSLSPTSPVCSAQTNGAPVHTFDIFFCSATKYKRLMETNLRWIKCWMLIWTKNEVSTHHARKGGCRKFSSKWGPTQNTREYKYT